MKKESSVGGIYRVRAGSEIGVEKRGGWERGVASRAAEREG